MEASIFALEPLESGGVRNRQGNDFQDAVAVQFCIEMLCQERLREVWCELHDDITLIWSSEGTTCVEFVQVKSANPNRLWSVSLLCQRDEKDRTGSSIIEKSMANGRCLEPFSFRIVTRHEIAEELRVLTLPLDHFERRRPARKIEGVIESACSKLGVKTEDSDRTASWVQNMLWEVVPGVEHIRSAGVLALSKFLASEGRYPPTEAVSQIYDNLLLYVRSANSAPDNNAAEKQIRRDALVDLTLLWSTESEKKFRSSGLSLRQVETERQRYTKALVEELDRPFFGAELFGLAVGIRQIYVPLRYCPVSAFAPRSEFDDLFHPNYMLSSALVADDDLGDWIRKPFDKTVRAPARMIEGNPGSGKSTLVRILAINELNAGRWAVVLPLQRLSSELNGGSVPLERAVNSYFRDSEEFTFDVTDLASVERPLLLVLDGLDEMSFADLEGAKDASGRTSSARLVQSAGELARTGRFRVIVTSRHIAATQVWNFLDAFERFQILPFFLPNRDGDSYQQVDHRHEWWRKFGQATGAGYSRLPDELGNEELEALTSEPLTNQLAAVAYFGAKGEGFNGSANQLFSQILFVVRRKEYETSLGRSHPAIFREINPETFERVLQHVAMAAWPSGGRRTNVTEIKEQFVLAGELERYERFIKPAGNRLPSVLILSYFRETDDVEFRGSVEFTHKSLGEYLVGRRIFGLLVECSGRSTGGTFEDAWKWLGNAEVGAEHLKFISVERDACSEAELAQIHEWISQRLKDFDEHGFDIVHKQSKFRDSMGLDAIVSSVRRTLRQLWVFSNIVCDLLARRAGPAVRRTVATERLLETLLARPARTDLVRAHLTYLRANGLDLSDLDVSNSNFNGCYLIACTLVDAVARRSAFNNATLQNCTLDKAILTGNKFDASEIGACSFLGADLTQSSFVGSILDNCKFSGADLRYVDFSNAKVNYGAFNETRMTGATFLGATLKSCAFRGADLRGINFSGCRVGIDSDFEQALTLRSFADIELLDLDGRPRSLAKLGWRWSDGKLHREDN